MRQRHYGRARRIRTQNSVRSSVFSSLLCFTFVQITLGNRVFRGFPGGSAGKESSALRETWVRSLGWGDPLEEETATHSSILAWRIPWAEKPGGPMGSQRVGHD